MTITEKIAHKEWEKWTETYQASFPIEEQRPLESIIRLIHEEERYKACIIHHEEQYVGLLTSWRFDTFIYIEHFAIDSGLRSLGYGGMALKAFIESQALPIIIEVEPPTTEIAKRRIGFYERNGFTLYRYDYHQPPYTPDRQSIPLLLMGTAPEKTIRPDAIVRTLHHEVYKVAP